MARWLFLALLVLLAFPAPASADIAIRRISHDEARAGAVVRVTARGFLGERPWPPMPVVIVAAGRAPLPSRSGTTPRMRRSRLIRPPYRLLGSIRRWRPLPSGHGIGELIFRVPRVAPGRYVFGLFCERCRRGPQGSLIIDPKLVLRVTPPSKAKLIRRRSCA